MKSRAEFPGAHLNLLFAIVLQYAREHDKLLQSLCHSEERINKVAKEEPSERKVNKRNGRVLRFSFPIGQKKKENEKRGFVLSDWQNLPRGSSDRTRGTRKNEMVARGFWKTGSGTRMWT